MRKTWLKIVDAKGKETTVEAVRGEDGKFHPVTERPPTKKKGKG